MFSYEQDSRGQESRHSVPICCPFTMALSNVPMALPSFKLGPGRSMFSPNCWGLPVTFKMKYAWVGTFQVSQLFYFLPICSSFLFSFQLIAPHVTLHITSFFLCYHARSYSQCCKNITSLKTLSLNEFPSWGTEEYYFNVDILVEGKFSSCTFPYFTQNGILHSNLCKVCDVEPKTNHLGGLRVKKPHWIIQKHGISFARFKSVEKIYFNSFPLFQFSLLAWLKVIGNGKIASSLPIWC